MTKYGTDIVRAKPNADKTMENSWGLMPGD
jgi:hypothetical protein